MRGSGLSCGFGSVMFLGIALVSVSILISSDLGVFIFLSRQKFFVVEK